MIKIVFEVSEDFIREKAKPENLAANIAADDGPNAVKRLMDLISFNKLEELIGKGKKEFIVKTDKLDEKSCKLYDVEIGNICALALFSETDKLNEKKG